MKLINKIKNLTKSKFGLSNFKIMGAPNTIVGVDGTDATATGGITFRSRNLNNKNQIKPNESFSTSFSEIGEIYVKNNEDAKDLIVNINGVVSISLGTANEQHEAIRVSYDSLSSDVINTLIKIYSFTSGDKIIFAKDDKQKNKFEDILNSMNISSVSIINLLQFE